MIKIVEINEIGEAILNAMAEYGYELDNLTFNDEENERKISIRIEILPMDNEDNE